MDPTDQLGIVRDIMEQHLKHDEQQRQQQQQEQEQQTIAALQQSAHMPLEAVTVDALQAHHHHHHQHQHQHEAMQTDNVEIHHHQQQHDDNHTAIVEAARVAGTMDHDMTTVSSPSSSALPSVGTPSVTPGTTSAPTFATTFHADTTPPSSVAASETAAAVAVSMSSAHVFAEATAMLESVHRDQDTVDPGSSSSSSAMNHMPTDMDQDEYDLCPKILRLPVDQWESWLEEQQKKCRWNMTRFRSRDKPTFARGPTASEWTREFQCVHAGTYRNRKNPNINPKKKRNRGKSIKVECTAFIKMRKMFNEDIVHIEYGWQHKNHSLDVIDEIRNQRLPFDLKAWIRQRVLEGNSWKTVKSILIANDSPLLDEASFTFTGLPTILNPTTRENTHMIITQCYGHYANVARQLKKKHGGSPADSPVERNNRGTIIQFEVDGGSASHPVASDAASAAATATWNLTSELSGPTLAIQSLASLQGGDASVSVTGAPTEQSHEAAAAAAAVVAMEMTRDPSEEIQRRLRELQEVTGQGHLHIDVAEPSARVHTDSGMPIETTSGAPVEPTSRVLTHHEALVALTAAATTPTPPVPGMPSPVMGHTRASNVSSMDIDTTQTITGRLLSSHENSNLVVSDAQTAGNSSTDLGTNSHAHIDAALNSITPRTSRTGMGPRAPNAGLPHARDQMRDILREIRQLESQMEDAVQYTNEDDAVRIIESFRIPIQLMKEAVERGASSR
ncbi:hypothetical protein BGZ73_001967 [Actinomortierella ambigua]|nr:hypothetical protein BGZ73_001967 [Actinomortierella ambigua]